MGSKIQDSRRHAHALVPRYDLTLLQPRSALDDLTLPASTAESTLD
jgi:hypothetical protein